ARRYGAATFLSARPLAPPKPESLTGSQNPATGPKSGAGHREASTPGLPGDTSRRKHSSPKERSRVKDECLRRAASLSAKCAGPGPDFLAGCKPCDRPAVTAGPVRTSEGNCVGGSAAEVLYAPGHGD